MNINKYQLGLCAKHALSFNYIEKFIYSYLSSAFGLRPYHAESTGSRPITEVKPRRAWIVLGWATALEPQVL